MHRTSFNIILILTAVLFGLLSFVSCTQEVMPPPETQIEKPLEKKEEEKNTVFDMDGGEAQVSVAMQLPYENGKSLSSNHDNTYEHFLLTTRYLSDRRDGSTITGEFVDLKLAANGNGGRDNVDLGWFTQGKWLFTVKAANGNGHVLYVGSWEGYVSAASSNSITISMEENTEDVGHIRLDVSSITLPNPRIVVTYNKVWNGDGEHVLLDAQGETGDGLTLRSESNGYTFYSTPDFILPAGAYWIKVQLWNGNELFSGEVLDTYIVPSETAVISGVFTITGLANFIRVAPDQTMKFTEACDEIELDAGKIVTGFHRLGFEDLVDFPYTNTYSEVQYLIPQIEDASKYFTISGGKVTGSNYPYKQVGFTYGYPDSPLEIAAGLFKGTASSRSKLNAIYAPGVSIIGSEAFSYTNLTDTFFGNISSIGAKAFYGSTVPDFDNSSFSNTVSIGSEAFRNSGLKYIDVPSGASVGDSAFTGSTSLYRTSFLVSKVPQYCFKGCSNLTQVLLESTEKIGTEAFYGCSSLEEIVLPSSLTIIEASAFNGCSSLPGTLNVPAAVTAIGENAFAGTNALEEIYLNAVCGSIGGSPWGADASKITWWAYVMTLNSNLPSDYVKGPGEEEFPQITEKNGALLSYPIPDPKFRLIAYNDVIGATLDGYAIPIPVIDGYALRGWFTDPTAGTEVTQLTVNKRKENWTAYAHWVRGLITVIFSGGRGGDVNTGTPAEIYRMVRYQGNYGRVGGEDEKDDFNKPLPTSTIPGRTFIGWYLEQEPMIDETSPDETAQSKLVRITDTTRVDTKKSHTLYAHYKDHRYTVVFNANLPSNASIHGTRNGTNVSSSYTVPSSYTVVYNQPFNKSWDPSKLSSPSYRGTTNNLPDLNADAYKLDNYYFIGWYLDPECTQSVYNAMKVPAQSSNGATINLYAKWIGKEKTVNLISRYKADPTDTTFVQKTVSTFAARFTAPNSYTNAWRSYFNKKVVSAKEIEKDTVNILPTINASTNGSYYVPGYTFSGWYTGFSDSSNEVTGVQIMDGNTFGSTPSEVEVPGSQSLYAKWVPNKYTVTFDAMGGTVSKTTQEVTYHKTYGELPVPTRAGYIFTGWYTTSQRSAGYGYKNADNSTYITASSYVRTVGDHKLYAGWSQVAVIPQSATSTTPINSTLTYSPTSNGGYYGSGTSNVASQNVAIKTVLVQSTNGTKSGSTWSDAPGVVAAPSQKVTVSCNSNGYVSASSSTVTTDASGNATFTVSTTATAIPGTSSVTLKTISTGLGTADGIVNVKLTGKITGITASPSSQTIYVRNSVVVTMSLTSSEGNLHASNCGLKFTHTGPDTYTQIAPGENPSTGWVVPGTTLTSSGVSSTITLRAGYEPASGTSASVLTATSTSPSLSTQLTAKCTVTISVPSILIEVGNGSNVSDFFTNVGSLYSKSSTAKAQWLVTGFRDWEGGDPDVASNSTTNLRAPGWTNNTGHKVYLFPVVPATYTSAGSQAGAFGSNAYLAFPTNVTKIGTYISSDSSDGYGDYKSATKIYIAGTGCTVGHRAFAYNGNDCEFKIVGSLTTIRPYAFQSSSGIHGITTNNFKAMVTIGDGAFWGALSSSYSHAVDLSGCTSLGWAAFVYSNITSLNTPITAGQAFQECKRLTTVSCSATTVQYGAFYYCTALSTVSLSRTTSIKAGAFRGCTALRSLAFPSTLTELQSHSAWNSSGCFEGSGLTSANLSSCSGLGTIGSACFWGCSSLTSISFHNNLNTVEYGAFYDTRISGDITFGGNLRTIGNQAFQNNVNITSITFGANGINIGYAAFYTCTKLSSIKFNSNSAITLGQEAFYGCSSLATVDFLNMGSSFNSCSFSTAGGGVWGGCALRHIKVTQGNFPSGSGTATTGKWLYFKHPVVRFQASAGCNCWIHLSGSRYHCIDYAFGYGWTDNNGAWRSVSSTQREDGGKGSADRYVYGIEIFGRATGSSSGRYEWHSETITYWKLGDSKATGAFNMIANQGYKFAGVGNSDYQESVYSKGYCNNYVYPNTSTYTNNISGLMAIR